MTLTYMPICEIPLTPLCFSWQLFCVPLWNFDRKHNFDNAQLEFGYLSARIFASLGADSSMNSIWRAAALFVLHVSHSVGIYHSRTESSWRRRTGLPLVRTTNGRSRSSVQVSKCISRVARGRSPRLTIAARALHVCMSLFMKHIYISSCAC